jgi:hypothetical protein
MNPFVTFASGGAYAYKVDNCVGLDERVASTKNQFILFPNPNSGVFSLKNSDLIPIDKIEIFDALGQSIKQFNPDYAIGIVARGESPIKQTLSRLRHSLSYGEREKVAKLAVLKGFHLVVDFYCIIWV